MRHPWFAALLCSAAVLPAQDLLVTGAKVLDEAGASFRDGCSVLVQKGRIAAIGPASEVTAPEGVRRLDLAGRFLIPGLIDLHTHFLLHPYNEASWDDQVLKESLELRTIRATVAAKVTLRAGFTTVRELGTEGAGFADVALRAAIEQGTVPGPRIFATTRAIVATGCYGPSGFDPRVPVPVGAQAADGPDGVRVAVRQQVAAGADWIKVYADYRRAPGAGSTATFSEAELQAICDEAASAGLKVVAHASTDTGAQRAVRAGVRCIEHGTSLSDETLVMMRERRVALCPTLAASEAMLRYRSVAGRATERMNPARVAFQRALKAGVTIACGSDAGVFAHGQNARELELMVSFGMTPVQALAAATHVAAAVLERQELGRLHAGGAGDLVALAADPLTDIAALRQVHTVIKAGVPVD